MAKSRKGSSDGATGASAAKRLGVRSGLLCLPPIVVALLRFSNTQVGFCFCAAAVWSSFEAGLVYRSRLVSSCKRIPFVLRLLGSTLLDVEACFLLREDLPGQSPEDRDAPDASDKVAEIPTDAAGASGGSLRGSAQTAAPAAPEPKPPRKIEKISVVLPCANETDFVAKTVKSVHEATPEAQLLEILVIDDASKPAIDRLIGQAELDARKARILRHDNAEGLIRSKKHGGDEAKGDAIIFLDCHVKPAQGWVEPLIRKMEENPKRVVVPGITSLNPDTWEEISPHGGASKMCMTWNADFVWCNGYPGDAVPIMSGGLLALTKYWWDTIGGYDQEMHAWGGENLDQSLRTWLCGGEIVAARDSRVAHMWRDASKPKTRLHYSIPTKHVRRNRLRAAQAWMGPWADKVRTYPEFKDFNAGGPFDIGDLANIRYYQEKLKCKSFDWYMHRFEDYYVGSGQLPDSIFNLREKSSGLCLHNVLEKGKSTSFQLLPCSQDSLYQRLHGANQATHGKCCSGLKSWGFETCVSASGLHAEAHASNCDAFGRNVGQHVQLGARNQIFWRERKGCLAPQSQEPSEQNTGDTEREIRFALCAAADNAAKSGQNFQKQNTSSGGDFLLRQPGTDACLAPGIIGRHEGLVTSRCKEDDLQQRWSHVEGAQLKNLGMSQCIDANDYSQPIIYPCYRPWDNTKQTYILHDNGWIEIPGTWADNGRLRYPARCLDSKPVAAVKVVVEECSKAEKAGVAWEKLWEEVPLETRLWKEANSKKSGFLAKG